MIIKAKIQWINSLSLSACEYIVKDSTNDESGDICPPTITGPSPQLKPFIHIYTKHLHATANIYFIFKKLYVITFTKIVGKI